MNGEFNTASDVAFTASVKALQTENGSRDVYVRMEQAGGWKTRITPELKTFVEAQTSVFFATANAQGQPYIQHRGGPPGFLSVLDESTLAFADFSGNRQYITAGNLAENAKAHLFLIDYAQRRRIKIWCTAEVVEHDRALQSRLTPPDYKTRVERVIRLTVIAWDVNCPQHIPQKIDATDVAHALAIRDQRIAELEFELKQLKHADG